VASQSLIITVGNARGASRVWGPYGKSPGGAPTFSYAPANAVLAAYGSADGSQLRQLGFYEYRPKACTATNAQVRGWMASREGGGVGGRESTPQKGL
jgi:hypothetical protein